MWGEEHTCHLRRLMVGEQYAHAERASNGRGALTDRTLADDTERGAIQIADVVREKAELVGFVPYTVLDISPVRQDVAAQSQNQGESMLRHRVHRVVASIGDGDAVLTALPHIDRLL